MRSSAAIAATCSKSWGVTPSGRRPRPAPSAEAMKSGRRFPSFRRSRRARSSAVEVTLLAHGVGLAKPGRQNAIELLRRFDPKSMQVVARRERLDLQEPWMIHATRQHQVTIEPAAAQRDRGEAHPHLERDARL